MEHVFGALAGSEKDQLRLLTGVLESLQDSYDQADLSGNLIFANPGASSMHGYSPV